MSSPIWNIIKKDLVRFRVELVIWCVLLVGRVTAGVDWSSDPQDSARESSAIFWVVAVFLLNVHLVVRVLGEDSPLKEAAFWRTRPISGGQMLAAKVIFLTGWTLLLPAAVIVAAGFAYGFSGGEILAVVAGQMMMHGFIGVVFLVATSFFQRVVATFVCFLLLGLFMQLTSEPHLKKDAEATFERASLEVTRTGLATGCLLAGCGVAVWVVYRSRRRTVAAVFIATGIAGMRFTASFWSLDFLGWMTVLNRDEAHEDARYTAVVSPIRPTGHATINGISYQDVSAMVKWSGLTPGEVCMPYRTEGSVTFSTGVQIKAPREETLAPDFRDLAAAWKSIGVENGPRSSFPPGETGVRLARLIEADYAKLKQSSAEWCGKISVRIGKVEPEWRLPLRAGTQVDLGATRVTMTDLNLDRTDLTLKIQVRRPDLPKWTFVSLQRGEFTGWSPQSYALVNVRRKEAVLSTGGGGSSGTKDGFFNFNRSEVRFSGAQGAHHYNVAEWAEWVKEAELVKLHFVETRRLFVEARVPLDYRQ